jgi:hypothetical protein
LTAYPITSKYFRHQLFKCEGYKQLNDLKARKFLVPINLQYPIQIWLTLTIFDKKSSFNAINLLQQSIFIHDIDPTYDGDQDYFMAIHRGELEPE